MATEWNIRVSDAEREAVAAQLREHYAQGRLSTDELNERLDRAFASKTRSELTAVMSDLPYAQSSGTLPSDGMHGGYQQSGWTGSNWTGPGQGSYGPRPSRGAVGAIIPVVLAFFCCFAVVSLFGFGLGSGPSIVVILLGALAVLRRIFGLGRRGPVRRRGGCGRRRW